MERLVIPLGMMGIISLLVAVRAYGVIRSSRGNVMKIMDVLEFRGMSCDTLIDRLGVPEAVREFSYKHKGQRYKSKIYGYKGANGMHFEYSTVEGVVTRVRVYSRMYYDFNAPDIAFDHPDDLFYMMGVEPTRGMKLVGKSPVALRYENVSDEVFEVYANGVGMDEGRAFMICVTFSSKYASHIAEGHEVVKKTYTKQIRTYIRLKQMK